MKKRSMAVLLALILALSMIACGVQKRASSDEKMADVTALLKKVEGMEAKTFGFTMDLDVAVNESSTEEANKIKLGIKVDGISQDDKKSQASISYRLGDSNEYKPFTTVTGDGTTAYLDFATLKTAAVDICNTYKLSQAVTAISVLPETEYIKVDAESLSNYLSSMTGIKVDVAGLKNTDTATYEMVMRTVMEDMIKTMQEATKDISPAPISGSESELKLSVTKDNLEAVCEELLKVDLNAKFEELLAKLKGINNADQYVTEFTNAKEEVVSDLHDALNEVKNEKDNFDVFNIEGNLEVLGETGARQLSEKISVSIEQKSEKAALTMELLCGEEAAKDKTVTIPSNAIDFTEYMNQVSSQLGY